MFGWIAERAHIVVSAFFAAMGIVYFSQTGGLLLCLAFNHLTKHWDEIRYKKQRELVEVLFEIGRVKDSCVIELVEKLGPFVGPDEINEILKKYNIEIKRHTDDYIDKNPPGPPRKNLLEWLKPKPKPILASQT